MESVVQVRTDEGPSLHRVGFIFPNLKRMDGPDRFRHPRYCMYIFGFMEVREPNGESWESVLIMDGDTVFVYQLVELHSFFVCSCSVLT